MKSVIDFVNQKKTFNEKIFNDLNTNKNGALILQFMLKQYLNAETEISVHSILLEIFGKEDYVYLQHLNDIEDLLENGWIIYGGMSCFMSEDAIKLEILNSSIALSSTFLKYFEFNKIDKILPDEINSYHDHLEYLKDQFLRIDYYQKLSKTDKLDFSSQKIDEKLKLLENKIAKKLETTNIKLVIEDIFKENSLNEKEQIIFLALLKEDYVGEFGALRDLNTLLGLISHDDYEKIKNRILLEDDSKLIENGLIEYDEMMSGFGGISRNFFINEEILQNIMYPHKDRKDKKLKLDILVQQQDIFELVTPTTNLDDVVMHPKTRELMDNLLKQVDKSVISRLRKWGIKKNRKGIDAKILLYGPPGTGKTMTATSLAKSLKKRILSFDCSKILSKYVGESEQNVRKIFDTYKDICLKTKSEPILLLNEADQFLSSRMETSSGGADKMHNQMQNIFLEQIEKFDGILVATTNFLESLDMAFSRRFDYKIAFQRPDFKQRLDLWRRVLPQKAVYEENFDINKLANYPLSGGQIVLVLKNTALKVAIKKEPIFTMEDFIQSIQRETDNAFGERKFVGFVS